MSGYTKHKAHLYLLCSLKKILLPRHFVSAWISSCGALVAQGHSDLLARVQQAVWRR